MKVMMIPHADSFRRDQSGIRRVVEAYFKYLPQFGIELVHPDSDTYDLRAVHAGTTGSNCEVAHLHGIYFTADYQAASWEYEVNQRVVDAVRSARQITVPSEWVTQTFRRDMHLIPHVVPHGIDWQDWQHTLECGNYILFNKNRVGDVCDPTAVSELARRFPNSLFITTFLPKPTHINIREIGLVPHAKMKPIIQQAGVYLSTTKETFGIGTLEAMASGTPVLGWRFGGNVDLIQHGVNGYLAEPGDYENLSDGLVYCFENRKTLGQNGIELSKAWTWQAACEKVAKVYGLAMRRDPPSVTVVIPCYNKEATIERAINSVRAQTFTNWTLVVVNDGSTDNSLATIRRVIGDGRNCTVVDQPNGGVAAARNRGISQGSNTYVCCLDGDDWIDPAFLQVCVDALEKDASLGITYTSLHWHKPDDSHGISQWPGTWEFDKSLVRSNQVPTCCVFRREMWQRLGGYRSRYCPEGAGAEDGEFWLRSGAFGWKAEKVTEEALFHYSWLSGQVTGSKNYKEVDYTTWHPWAKDKQHPFASYATPQHLSHPVRQYDEPGVSVIIPVGPGHENEVINAIDSLEAQTYRKWECVVVWDCELSTDYRKWFDGAFPFARQIHQQPGQGAGVARNRGVGAAVAPFLLFLDADDWLYPEALDKMLEAWAESQSIPYTDYVGKAFIMDERDRNKLKQENRLLAEMQGHECVIAYQAFEFDCERALRQPENPPYVFCNVTALVPKAWHEEIGGFDEGMESWEDVDYHWRMVRAGHCYKHIPEHLMVYRFYTGTRRDRGLQLSGNLIQYLREKYEGIPAMACSGCNKSRPLSNRSATIGRMPAPAPAMAATGGSQVSTHTIKLALGGSMQLSDDDLMLARYLSPNVGQHRVIGSSTKLDYGYHKGGDIFLVHKRDMASNLFTAYQEIRQAAAAVAPQVVRQAPPPPAAVTPVAPLEPPKSVVESDIKPVVEVTPPPVSVEGGGVGAVAPTTMVRLNVDSMSKMEVQRALDQGLITPEQVHASIKRERNFRRKAMLEALLK